jgi:hypothetical protein
LPDSKDYSQDPRTTFAKPWWPLKGVIEDLELLGSLSVVSRSQNLEGYFPFVPNHFLQRERVSLQLLGKAQQPLQIYGIRRSSLGNLPTKAFHWMWESNCRTREGTSFRFHASLLSLTAKGVAPPGDDVKVTAPLGSRPTHNLCSLHQNRRRVFSRDL